MKKIISFLCVIFTLSLCAVGSVSAAEDYTLNGNEFTVYTANGLMQVAMIINGEQGDTSVSYTSYNINIANDIDMSGKSYKPIGKNDSFVYTGSVKGNGHTISNLKRENYTGTCLGFIGVAGIGASVQDLNLQSVTLSSVKEGTGYVGGIIGKAKGAGEASVKNCTVSGVIKTNETGAGGIIGAVTSIHASITVSSCTVNADITALSSGADGIVGYAVSGASVTSTSCVVNSAFIQSGTEFTVRTPDALIAVASMINSDTSYSSATVNVAKDLDMTGKSWTPIGKNASYAFKGVINGCGNTVSNLTNADNTASDIGFIGFGADGCTVNSLHLKNVNFTTSSDRVGGIIANVTSRAAITDCSVEGTLYAGGNYCGGLVGVVSSSSSDVSISHCAVNASITSKGHSASGIVAGDTAGGYKTNDISTFPTVTSDKVYVTGSISANYRVGSFMGYNFCVNASFKNCISTATLDYTRSSDNGAFLAIDNYSKIYLENCIAFSDLHAFYSIAKTTSVQTVEIKNCYLMKDSIGKNATIATYNKYGFYEYDTSAQYKYRLIADIIVDGVGAEFTPYTTTNTTYRVPVIQYDLPSGTENDVISRAYSSAMAMFKDGSIQESFVHKHTWINEKTTLAPTYYSNGKASYECAVCHSVKTVQTPCKESSVGWKFDTATKTLSIYGSGSMGKFATPSTIPWKAHKNEIVSVIIQSGVTDICDYAFYDCTSLQSITIPQGVSSVGAYAFHNCRSLSYITLPSTVKTICDHAFEYCPSLKQINIPQSVTSIGYGVFRYAKYARPVINSSSSKYTVTGNCIIDTENKSVIAGFANSTIPTDAAAATSIGRAAFQGCKITDITIPQNVTSVEMYAFADCTSLRSVSISQGMTDIGEGAFYGCAVLEMIDIPSKVTSIGALAFNECTELKYVTLPQGLQSIGISSFRMCNALVKASFGGTSAEWQSVTIANGNDILKSKITANNSVAMLNTYDPYILENTDKGSKKRNTSV